MNENGKSVRDGLIMGLVLMIFGLVVHEYLEMTGSVYPSTAEFQALFKSAEFLEHVFTFVLCAFWIATVHTLGFIAVNIAVYSVYFVQRAWYLHKLRKPERVYTGDPL